MEGKGGAHERDGRVHNGGGPPDFTAWTPSDWSAFGTCATFAVAFVAAIYAKGQLAEARTLRKEQAQPYVAVYMQASPGHQRQIDLVVRNFGATVAKDVQVLIHPPPERSGVGGGTRDRCGYQTPSPLSHRTRSGEPGGTTGRPGSRRGCRSGTRPR